MGKKQVVLAMFADEAAADAAVVDLKAWDKMDDDVKLNAIGVLALDDKGKVKVHKMGRRTTFKGAGLGAGIAVVLLAVAVPIGIIPAAIVGGAAGALHHKNLGLKADEKERIGAELAGGKAAVGVLCDDDEVAAVTAKLVELGGQVEAVDVADEVVAEADAAAPAVEAEAAAEEAPAADAATAEAPAAEA